MDTDACAKCSPQSPCREHSATHTFPSHDHGGSDGDLVWDDGSQDFYVKDASGQKTLLSTNAAKGSTVAVPNGNFTLDADQVDGHHASSFKPSGVELGDHFVTKVEYTKDDERNLLALCCNRCGQTLPCGGIIDHLADEQTAVARLWMYGYYLDRACE